MLGGDFCGCLGDHAVLSVLGEMIPAAERLEIGTKDCTVSKCGRFGPAYFFFLVFGLLNYRGLTNYAMASRGIDWFPETLLQSIWNE
jgi:hypothetical protein